MYFGNLGTYRLQSRPFGNHPTLNNGLIEYFKFEETSTDGDRLGALGRLNWSVDDTIAGASYSINGKSNNAFSTGTTGSDLTITSSILTPNAIISFNFWVYRTVASINAPWLFNPSYAIYWNGINDTIYASIETSIGTVSTAKTNVIPINTWTMVYVAFDTIGTIDISINGNQPVSVDAGVVIAPPTSFYLTMYGAVTVGQTNLLADEMGIFNRRLTYSELQSRYDGGNGLFY